MSRRSGAAAAIGLLTAVATAAGLMGSASALAATGRSATAARTARATGRGPAAGASGATGSWQQAQQVAAALNTGGSAKLNSVACTSAGNCAGGGSYQVKGSYNAHAFVANETAGHWSSDQEVAAGLNAGASGEVTSVACTMTGNCAAVGYYTDGSAAVQAFVVDEVNGSWGSAQEVPGLAALNAGNNANLMSVSCSTAGNCTAGGYYADGSKASQAFVVDEVDGTWGNAREVPGIAALNAGGNAHVTSVSCASPGNCAAAGYYTDGSLNTQAFVVDETKGAWGSAVEVPGSGALNSSGTAGITSVSCPAAGACVAGGYFTGSSGEQALVTSQTNGTWGSARQVPGLAALNKDDSAGITALSCASAGSCGTVGFYTDGSRHYQAFVATEARGTWGSAREIPGTGALNKGGHAVAYAISCPGPGNCSAGGFYTDGSSAFQAFVVTQSGGTWGKAEVVPGSTRLNSGGRAAVLSVSCSAAATCGAGGYYSTGAAVLQAFGVDEHPARTTSTTLRLSRGKVTFGNEQVEHVSVAVTPSTATGKVAVFAPLGHGKTHRVCLITLSGGKGSCRPGHRVLPGGRYHLKANYLGGGSLRKSTSRPRSLLVEKATTRTALRLSARTIRYGSEHAERFSVRVRPQYSGVPGWKVIIFARRAGIHPFAVCTIHLKKARGSCRPSARRFRPGTYQITARYRGSHNFRASASSRHRLRVS